MFRRLLFCAVLLALPPLARSATIVPDRPTLNAILGTPIVDDFSTYVVAPLGHSSTFTFLDATTVVDGQGPGLVSDGVTISKPGDMAFFGDNSFIMGSTEKLLFGNGTMEINFVVPVPAFGLSWETDPPAFSTPVVFEVFAADDTTSLGTWMNPLYIDAPYLFFSVEDAAGIGKVTMNLPAQGRMGFVDNITYAIPEPGTAAVAIAGLLLLVAFSQRTSRQACKVFATRPHRPARQAR